MTIDIYPYVWYNIVTVKDKDSPKNQKGNYYELQVQNKEQSQRLNGYRSYSPNHSYSCNQLRRIRTALRSRSVGALQTRSNCHLDVETGGTVGNRYRGCNRFSALHFRHEKE